MPLATGTKIGPYEILSSLGAGGMGEVYRARDSRLGRDVASKVLPESMARDAECLRRFETEAPELRPSTIPTFFLFTTSARTQSRRIWSPSAWRESPCGWSRA